jgi:hypothetical protein
MFRSHMDHHQAVQYIKYDGFFIILYICSAQQDAHYEDIMKIWRYNTLRRGEIVTYRKIRIISNNTGNGEAVPVFN